MTMVESESSTRGPADQGDYAIQLRTRRNVLAGTAAAVALVTSGILIDQRARARDEDEDGDDRSGHGGRGDDNRPDDERHGLPPDQSTQVAGVAIVQIIDERFEPNNILIETGQTVTWVNQDDDQHTASGKSMDTGVINPGEQGSVTFLEPGEFPYTCNFHPEMLGLVTVTGESRATPDAAEGASNQSAPMAADVEIVDFAFDPEVATVAVGGSITWTNIGAAPHTVLGGWADSDIMDPGAVFTFTFEEAGTYEYQCGLHPAMVGTIEVVDADAASAEGTPTSALVGDLSGTWQVEVEFQNGSWLPDLSGLVEYRKDETLEATLIPRVGQGISESSFEFSDGYGTWSYESVNQVRAQWYVVVTETSTQATFTASVSEAVFVESEDRYFSAVAFSFALEGEPETSYGGLVEAIRLTRPSADKQE